MKRPCCCAFVFFIIGILFVGAGIAAWFLINMRINAGIDDANLVSTDPADEFNDWVTTNSEKIPYFRRFYMWNLTNAADVVLGAKPTYSEIGPYIYRQYKTRKNVTFSDEDERVTFNEHTVVYYESELTGEHLSEDDMITNINPAYIAVMQATSGEQGLALTLQAGAAETIQSLLTTVFVDIVLEQFFSQSMPENFAGFLEHIQNNYNMTFEEAEAFAFTQFANATDNYQNDPAFGAWRISKTTPSGLSLQITKDLWNFSFPFSFFDDDTNSSITWYSASQGEPEARQLLMSQFPGITPAQFQLVLDWRVEFKKLITPAAAQYFGVPELVDIAYLQWGNASVLPTGVAELYDLPGPPEFKLWANESLGAPMELTVDQSKAILNPVAPGVTTVEGLVMYMTYVAAGNYSAINATYGLNAQEANAVAAYLGYLNTTFAFPLVQQAFASGGGLFTTRSVNEWLWTGVDPLLTVLEFPAHVNLQDNDTTLLPHTIYTGTGDKALINEYIKWENKTEILVWEAPVRVGGTTDGTQFAYPVKDENLKIFVDEILRPATFFDAEDVKLHDIKLIRFKGSEENFAVNPLYYQYIPGFANMTVTRQAPIFFCQPHFLQAPGNWTQRINGVSEPEPALHEISIDVEPITGRAMRVAKRLQVNVYIAQDNTWFNTFNPDMYLDAMYPLIWAEDVSELGEDDANSFKNTVYLFKNMALGLLISCAIVGAILGLVIPIIILLACRRDESYEVVQ